MHPRSMTPRDAKKQPPMTNCDNSKLHVALTLNNRGVNLMESGEILRAISLLQQSSALCGEAVRQIRNTPTACEPSCKNPRRSLESSITVDADEGSDGDWQQDKRPEPRTALDFSCSPFTLPSRLHLIEKTASKYKMRGYLDWTALKLNSQPLSLSLNSFMMVSCVASINLALCYQFLGFCHALDSTPCSRRHSLTMAAKSYEVAHYIMTQVPELQSDIRMLLQIMNNRCRILAALGDRRRVGLCSQRLVSMLMYVVDHEEIDISSTLLSKYLSNVCHLILRKKETAPAA